MGCRRFTNHRGASMVPSPVVLSSLQSVPCTTPQFLHKSGCSAVTAMKMFGCAAQDMRLSGYTAAEMRLAGYGLECLRTFGYPCPECVAAGFPLQEVMACFGVEEFGRLGC